MLPTLTTVVGRRVLIPSHNSVAPSPSRTGGMDKIITGQLTREISRIAEGHGIEKTGQTGDLAGDVDNPGIESSDPRVASGDRVEDLTRVNALITSLAGDEDLPPLLVSPVKRPRMGTESPATLK